MRLSAIPLESPGIVANYSILSISASMRQLTIMSNNSLASLILMINNSYNTCKNMTSFRTNQHKKSPDSQYQIQYLRCFQTLFHYFLILCLSQHINIYRAVGLLQFLSKVLQMFNKSSLLLLTYSAIFLTALYTNVQEHQSTVLASCPLDLSNIKEIPWGSLIYVDGEKFSGLAGKQLAIKLNQGGLEYYSFQGEETSQWIKSSYSPQQIAAISVVEKTSRLLQAYNTGFVFLDYSMLAFQTLLGTFRNLIVLALCTNLLDAVLPFVTLCNAFLMVAFLDTKMHLIHEMYYNIFNSKLDFFNIVRLMISPSGSYSTNTLLSQYNFSPNLFFNISGEFLLMVIFLGITVFLKLGSIFCNSERMRQIKASLRGLWNGLFIALLPQLATFSGFHLRMMDGSSGIINVIFSAGVMILFILFFIQLVCQIRSIINKIEYIEDTRFQIGLASRINHRQDFHFDCISFNMLYHPLVNYLRLLLFFLPIGAGFDLYYVAFGGPLVAQLFMMMADVSCPFFNNRRDRIFMPFGNFLFMLIQLGIVSVGLAQSVSHSEVSLICELVTFGLATFLYSFAVICLFMDLKENLRRKCKPSDEADEDAEEDEATQKIGRGEAISPLNKKVKKTEHSEDIKEDDSEIDDYSAASMTKKPTKVFHLKIKKVKRGRII